MRPLVILLALAAAASVVDAGKLGDRGLAKGNVKFNEDEDPEDPDNEGAANREWAKFKAKRGKRFGNAKEEKQRQRNHHDNLKRVSEHNELFAEGKTKYKMRIHEYSDWSLDEIKAKLSGSTKVPSENSIRRLSRAPEGVGQSPRANATLFRRKRSITPWSSLDYRNYGCYVGPVINQGDCGCCWAVVAAQVLAGQACGCFGKKVEVSAQNLIDCAKSPDYGNFGCSGGWPMNAFDYVRANKGIDPEAPYPLKSIDTQKCAYDESKKIADLTVSGGQYLPAGNEAELLKAVFNVGPMAVAINADSWGFINYASGVYVDDTCSKDVNHAVLLIGYGNEGGTNYWLIKNSWGSDWGEGGYIKLARDHNNQCGIASWGQYPEP